MEPTGRLDAVALGETMALFVPGERPGTWAQTIGGAESNVACHLAGLGLRSGWLGAVGDDELGRAVVSAIAAAGVDVSGVVIDEQRPTGLYLKEIGPSGTRVRYYRSGSAASALGPELVSVHDLDGVRLVHTSGITPALSASCRDLMRVLFRPRRSYRLSFDVNWRPVLWAGQDPSVLVELANAADVVLVGADEAEAIWGCARPGEIREVLPGPDTLVVKHGEHGATLIERDPTGVDAAPLFQPALTVVDVVEAVGAGDAFAAGFLAATLAGAPPRQRLRAGHLRAAGALSSTDDLGTPLPPDVVATLLDADEAAWAAWRSVP